MLPALLLAAAPLFAVASPVPAPPMASACCGTQVCCCAAEADTGDAECRCHVSDGRGEVVIPLDGEPGRTGQTGPSPFAVLQVHVGTETATAMTSVYTSRAGVALTFPVYLRDCSLLI